MATKTKDKNKLIEKKQFSNENVFVVRNNQLTFNFFDCSNEIKKNKEIKIFRKQNVNIKKNHLKKNRRVRRIFRSK